MLKCTKLLTNPFKINRDLTKVKFNFEFLNVFRREGPNVLNNDTIKGIAAKYSKSSAQVILRYFIQKNIVLIPKSVTPNRIKENLDVYNFSLDPEDVKAMEALDKGEEGRTFAFGKNNPE